MARWRSLGATVAVAVMLGLVAAACGPADADPDPTQTTPSAAAASAGSQDGSAPADRGWMGTNLGVASSFAEWAFLDVFKFSSDWVSGTPWAVDRQPVWNDERPLDLDEHGWVRSLLPDQVARTAMLTGPLPVRPAGKYVVLYDGEGEIEYTAGASLAESTRGRDVIDVVSTAEVALNIVAVNPENYIRNIRVIMPGGVYADAPGTLVLEPAADRADYLSFEEHYEELVFHPQFLDSLEGYASVRFMNWMLTNGSTVSEWGDRPLETDARWTTDGVPVEVVVDLANASSTDPWFTLPHLATDEFVREFATVVRNRLDPALVPYVEYSNEVWNTQFDQFEYSSDQGMALGLDDDPFTAAVKFYGQRSGEIFAIWDEVFGDPGGFVAVVGSKTSDPDAVSKVALESGDVMAHADVLGVAGYFGGSTNWDGQCDDIADMSLDEFFQHLAEVSVPAAVDRISEQVDIADRAGLELAVYEGGQHLRVNRCSGDDVKRETIGALFDAASRDPRMADVYLEFFAAIEAVGVDHFSHYTNTGAWTPFGRFGAREHLLQTREEMPKYDAIMTYAGRG